LVAAPGQGAGTVYYYVNGSWKKEKIVPTEQKLRPGDKFGSAVALSGDTAVFSAPGTPADVVAAYAYVLSGEKWKLQQDLLPPVALFPSNEEGINFGQAVGVSGDTALVSGPEGSAVPYIRSGTSWAAQSDLGAEITASLEFGSSVALSGNTALVGAPGTSEVWVFTF
jgi:hypothetical protein